MQNTCLIRGFNIIHMSVRNCTLKQWRSTIYYTLNRMTKNFYKTNETKRWPGYGVTRALVYCQLESKMVQTFWKTVWLFITKLKFALSYHSAVPVLGIYPNKLDMYIHTNTCPWMLITALFFIAKVLMQPRCPSKNE